MSSLCQQDPRNQGSENKTFFTPLESSGPSHSLQFMYQLHTWLVVLFNYIVDLKFSPIFWTKCMRFQDMKFYIVCYCLSQPSMVQWLRSPFFPCSFVPPFTNPVPLLLTRDLVPSYINQYLSILTQYHQVSTSTNLYCCCLGITDFCTVYPGCCFDGIYPGI